MAIGMTYEQYWYDDPLMVRAFYKADRLRRERMDEEAWINGLYVLNALDTIVGNLFREDGSTLASYPEEPYSIARKRKAEEEKKKQREEQEAIWARAWMESFVMAGKNFGKNKKQEG